MQLKLIQFQPKAQYGLVNAYICMEYVCKLFFPYAVRYDAINDRMTKCPNFFDNSKTFIWLLSFSFSLCCGKPVFLSFLPPHWKKRSSWLKNGPLSQFLSFSPLLPSLRKNTARSKYFSHSQLCFFPTMKQKLN